MGLREYRHPIREVPPTRGRGNDRREIRRRRAGAPTDGSAHACVACPLGHRRRGGRWRRHRALADNVESGPASINPNLFQDQAYKFGSFGNPDPAVRQRALEHLRDSVAIARRLNSRDISLWFADGSNYPGTAKHPPATPLVRGCAHIGARGARPRPASARRVQAVRAGVLPYRHRRLGHGAAAARAAGPQARVLVDTGHHYLSQNIEQIVAWLLAEGMLGGFHFNDRRYADDDLTLGSIDPYQVFRIFHEIHFFEWETRRARRHRVHDRPEPQPEGQDRGDDPDRDRRPGAVREGRARRSRRSWRRRKRARSGRRRALLCRMPSRPTCGRRSGSGAPRRDCPPIRSGIPSERLSGTDHRGTFEARNSGRFIVRLTSKRFFKVRPTRSRQGHYGRVAHRHVALSLAGMVTGFIMAYGLIASGCSGGGRSRFSPRLWRPAYRVWTAGDNDFAFTYHRRRLPRSAGDSDDRAVRQAAPWLVASGLCGSHDACALSESLRRRGSGVSESPVFDESRADAVGPPFVLAQGVLFVVFLAVAGLGVARFRAQPQSRQAQGPLS